MRKTADYETLAIVRDNVTKALSELHVIDQLSILGGLIIVGSAITGIKPPEFRKMWEEICNKYPEALEIVQKVLGKKGEQDETC